MEQGSARADHFLEFLQLGLGSLVCGLYGLGFFGELLE